MVSSRGRAGDRATSAVARSCWAMGWDLHLLLPDKWFIFLKSLSTTGLAARTCTVGSGSFPCPDAAGTSVGKIKTSCSGCRELHLPRDMCLCQLWRPSDHPSTVHPFPRDGHSSRLKLHPGNNPEGPLSDVPGV